MSKNKVRRKSKRRRYSDDYKTPTIRNFYRMSDTQEEEYDDEYSESNFPIWLFIGFLLFAIFNVWNH